MTVVSSKLIKNLTSSTLTTVIPISGMLRNQVHSPVRHEGMDDLSVQTVPTNGAVHSGLDCPLLFYFLISIHWQSKN